LVVWQCGIQGWLWCSWTVVHQNALQCWWMQVSEEQHFNGNKLSFFICAFIIKGVESASQKNRYMNWKICRSNFRLFSCGTSKDGESFLVEWNESEGAIKRTYSGFRKKSDGVVQFDTTRNHFLAAGEENQIKFWDMDNVNVLASIDAEGGLPVSIVYCFH
jgi:hypothetical protein